MHFARAVAALALALPASLPEAPVARAAPVRPAAPAPSLSLRVDATDTQHRVFRVEETLVSPADMPKLLYPQWSDVAHAPDGRIDLLANLHVLADGREVRWRRDPLDMFAFRIDARKGQRLTVRFDVLTPLAADEGRVVMSDHIATIRWDSLVLYPAGDDIHDIAVTPSLTLPAGWDWAGDAAGTTRGATTTFAPVPLERLVDTPVYAGAHHRRFDLAPGAATPIFLDAFAEAPEQLDARPATIAMLRRMVRESLHLLGRPAFDRYHFLITLSDQIYAGSGSEHRRSSENGWRSTYLTDPDRFLYSGDRMPHEFVHAWNGRAVAPLDILQPNLNTPRSNELMWVYEGLTKYLGLVLTARAGTWTPDQLRDNLALTIAGYDTMVGRQWRPLQDTVHAPILDTNHVLPWVSWQRGYDYYDEGALVWLEVDVRLRELTGGRKSLDDFCRSFFAPPASDTDIRAYGFDDIVAGLNAIAPFDWAGLLRRRLDETGAQGAPRTGVELGGYRMTFRDVPNAFQRATERPTTPLNLTDMAGLVILNDGTIDDVLWGGAGDAAGLRRGEKIAAVDGVPYAKAAMLAAVARAKGASAPIMLGIVGRTAPVALRYQLGLRYPWLERRAGTPDRLTPIFLPQAG